MGEREKRREQFLEKSLPSSAESEHVIIGAILVDNDVMAQAAECLSAEDLYSPLNRRIFRAMLSLFEKQSPIDPILIGEELKKEGSLESIGGVSTIMNLSHGMPHFSNIEKYIQIVIKKKRLRNLITACNSITAEAIAEESDADIICDHAERSIFDVCQRPSISRPERIDVLTHESLLITEMYVAKGVAAVGTASGLSDLDDKTGGWKKGDLVVVAGRPSMGKTILGLQSAYWASGPEAVSLFFSLEMSKQQVAARIICAETKTDLHWYMNGRIVPAMFDRAVSKYNMQPIDGRKMFVDDSPGITPMQVLAKARRVYAEHKRLDLIVVDYLQLMTCSKRTESRQQEVSQISRELKSVAKELDVPVIAVSQLSRAVEARNPPRPMMSDLRESGSIEQDADVVIFIYREEYYKKTDDNAGVAEIIIAKQRNGPTGSIKAAFQGNYVRFDNFYEV